MLHLQSELQIRHDRRLDLAAKRRKHEDDHVTMMREVEEDAVWSWWKVSVSTLPIRRNLICLYLSSSVMSYKQICMRKPTGNEGRWKERNAYWNAHLPVRLLSYGY
jgi:hypothetical protein